MNAKLFRLTFQGLTLVALLAACSGGDVNVSANVRGTGIDLPLPPTQNSEDVTAKGAITGLGGVTVNDVYYATNSVIVTVNGQPGTLADLKHGHIITVSGRINADGRSGTANSILFDADLIGPVDDLDAPNDQLIVMGQSVITDGDTLFGGGIDPGTFAGLSVGNVVQISGYPDAAGTIRATRIDPAAMNAELQLIGEASSVDAANLRFRINRLTVDYSSAIVIDLPGGAPSNGMTLKVIGTMSGGHFVVERLETPARLVGATGQRVQTAGVITRFNSSSDFDVNNSAVSIDAGTAFLNGDADDLALNTRLVIDGDFTANGRITANRISFGRLIGDTTTVEFGFSNFTEIAVSTVFKVTVTQGQDYSVEVIVDESAAHRVGVTQTGSRLNFALGNGDDNIEILHAFVTMPALDRIDLSGVVNATLNNFNQQQMTVNVGGVSRLHGNGLTIRDLMADVSGVSRLDFGDIRPIRNANIEVGGVSQATLNMDVGSTMTGSVGTGQGTGVSTLYYYGTDVSVNVAADTLSSVVRLGDTRP